MILQLHLGQPAVVATLAQLMGTSSQSQITTRGAPQLGQLTVQCWPARMCLFVSDTGICMYCMANWLVLVVNMLKSISSQLIAQ